MNTRAFTIHVLKDERHTTDIIKCAIQVQSLSERDGFMVIVNNRITKQHKYRLLNQLQYDRNKMTAHPRWRSFQYGGHFKMADFQQRNLYGGNFNIAIISIWGKISQFGNANSDTPLIETDNINTALYLRVYSNRDLLAQVSTRSFKQR